MTSWRDHLLARFPASRGDLILAADPDGLLREEQVLAALTARGYDLLTFDDPIAFRYAYESRYRIHEPGASQAPGASARPALIVRTDRPDLRGLPYDLLAAGRRLTLSLRDLLPGLSYPVARDFFRAAPELLDRLIAACRDLPGPRLGDQRSLAFIARHVYNLDPGALDDLNDLVERLLQVHYHGWPLFDRLRAWLADELGRKPAFAALPVARWLADRRSFFEFVEGQWRAYLRGRGLTLAEAGPVYELHPLAVDFARPGLRAIVGALFVENRLRPAPIIAERPPADWTALGAIADAVAYRQGRLEQLLDHIADHFPEQDAGHRAWLALAPLWAEATVLRHGTSTSAAVAQQFQQVQARLNQAFLGWLQTHYNALHSLPYLPAPVVGHQAAHALAARLRGGTERIALLVLDGLSLDSWQVLRDAWGAGAPNWRYTESALFACLPTVTPIARQALFAGQLPLYFADTWNRTDADERRWRRFWEEQGLFASAVCWLRGVEDLDAILADPRVRALGLVINTVDDMLHGAVGGLGELHQRVRLWAERGELAEAIGRLLRAGFDIWLTSDHGCTAARGIGRPREGVLVEGRGTRVRFYTDPAFLARARSDAPEALAWTPAGLPAGLLTLFAPGDAAFAAQGEQIVAHGGLSLAEVIVPWVHVTQAPGASEVPGTWSQIS